MFAEGDNTDKHYPIRSGQTSLSAAVTNITKPVTKNNFGPSTQKQNHLSFQLLSFICRWRPCWRRARFTSTTTMVAVAQAASVAAVVVEL